jgi:hypothetical protein
MIATSNNSNSDADNREYPSKQPKGKIDFIAIVQGGIDGRHGEQV